jgi:hypothetical protein
MEFDTPSERQDYIDGFNQALDNNSEPDEPEEAHEDDGD